MERLFHSLDDSDGSFSRRVIWAKGPVIVGAGLLGIATAACLKKRGVPFLLLERQEHIGSCWQKTSFERRKLHLPKHFYQLPNMSFPQDYPEYPTIRQYIDYLDSYADHFDINPIFNEFVQSAKYDKTWGLWRVKSISTAGPDRTEMEYFCRWVVVATGEHDEYVMPNIEGLAEFHGEIIHAFGYKSGEKLRRQKVLVVGCGNSGMEVSLDLCKHNAFPILVVRSPIHVLPREICGKSIFELAVLLLMWLPLWLVDKLLLLMAWLVLGNVEKYGLKRPSMGPLEMMKTMGKTPVFDNGALEKIRAGDIKVVSAGIKKFRIGQVELANGEKLNIDSVVMATGYRSSVPFWLQEEGEVFYKKWSPFPNGWKGKSGLYGASRGLCGASSDALRIASDIGKIWKEDSNQRKKNIAHGQRCLMSEF